MDENICHLIRQWLDEVKEVLGESTEALNNVAYALTESNKTAKKMLGIEEDGDN